ncbi:hypothetical protein ACHQM5_000714 [Ranunculus cassubicifolius]
MRMKTAAIHLPLFFLLFCITSGTTKDTVSGYNDKARVHNGEIAEIIKRGGGGGRGGGFSGGGIGGRSGGATGSRGYTGGIRGGSGPGVIIAHGGGHEGGHGRNGVVAKDPATVVFIAMAAAVMVSVTMIFA